MEVVKGSIHQKQGMSRGTRTNARTASTRRPTNANASVVVPHPTLIDRRNKHFIVILLVLFLLLFAAL